MLVGGRSSLDLWDLARHQREAKLRQAVEEGRREGVTPTLQRALGAWYAFRGELRGAVALLEAARAAGERIPTATLVRAHWELGHHHRALALLADADLPSYLVGMLREELTLREEVEGSRLGLELDLVHDVAFTPDGRTAVSSSDARTTPAEINAIAAKNAMSDAATRPSEKRE